MEKRVDSRSPTTNEDPLKDKVALLFDGTNTGGRSLAVSLAKYGADIAIVYRQAHAGHAYVTKRLVEAEGRRCLIIPAQANDENFSKEVVRQTINTLNRFDIFIDYSSLTGDEIGPANSADNVEQHDGINPTSPFINVGMISAALDQMVSLDQTNTRDDEPNKVMKMA
jgi:NAD(P)-dependent dehydrogenase (short-subunit alcohol dehydrogenase family)